MQGLLVAFSLLALTSATRKPVDQAALGSAYGRLVKAAAQVEKVAGDASLLEGKHSKAATQALFLDPKTITKDAAQLATQAYAVMGSNPPAPLTEKNTDDLHIAYHEILHAAEGVELVRRHAATLTPEKVTAFAAEMQKGPEKVEKDVSKLEEDMKEAEEDKEDAKKELKEAKAQEEGIDDTQDHTAATAAKKAADQALAEADHEQHGGSELVGKAEEDKKAESDAAAKKAEAKTEVEAATAQHKEADAAHEKVAKEDDKHDEKVEKAEEKHEEAKDEHEEAIDAHNVHPETTDVKKEKSGARHVASCAVVVTLAMFC